MRKLVSVLGDIWPSLVASVLAAFGAFLSLGVLGLLLYYLVSPALDLVYPPLEAWDQTVVWPLIVAAPLLWSPSFVVAGLLNRRLKIGGWRRASRIFVYVALVWFAALGSWWIILSVNSGVWQ